MRTFKHFNQETPCCPVCQTKNDKPAVLIPIPGTEKGNIMQAEQVHKDCWDRIIALTNLPPEEYEEE